MSLCVSRNKIQSYIEFYCDSGLIEGDGHIYVPDTLYNDKGFRRYCFIRIVFSKPDRPFAEYLQSKLGGFIVDYNTYVTLQIVAFDKLVFIINSINGCMRTPKIEALHRLINFLQTHYPSFQVQSPKGLDLSPLDSNSRLAGMTDAEFPAPRAGDEGTSGNFNIIITKDKVADFESSAVRRRTQNLRVLA